MGENSATKTKGIKDYENNMNTLGVFHQPSYISIDDKYANPKDFGRDLTKGKRQMLSSPPKQGKVGSGVFFEKDFKPLFDKEPYVDTVQIEKKYQSEKKKLIKEGPFVPSSPPKKASGLGSNFGTIGKPYEHLQEFDPNVKKEHKAEPHNFYTNPPKKGTYGFTKLGFSDLPQSIGGSKEEPKKKKSDDKPGHPFKSTSKPLDFFDAYPNVAASKVYTNDKPLPPEKPETPKKKEHKSDGKRPFTYSSPPKAGYNSTINKFPEYIPDQYDKNKIRTKQDAEKLKHQPIWKAVSNPKSLPSRSVIFGAASLQSTL